MTAYGSVRLLGNPRALERAPARQIRIDVAEPAPALDRRRLSSPSRAGQRPHPVGRLLAVVLLTFMIGLVYLAQVVQIAGTNLQADKLAAQRDDLARQAQTLDAALIGWGTESLVVERAQALGFDILTGRTRIAAR